MIAVSTPIQNNLTDDRTDIIAFDSYVGKNVPELGDSYLAVFEFEFPTCV